MDADDILSTGEAVGNGCKDEGIQNIQKGHPSLRGTMIFPFLHSIAPNWGGIELCILLCILLRSVAFFFVPGHD